MSLTTPTTNLPTQEIETKKGFKVDWVKYLEVKGIPNNQTNEQIGESTVAMRNWFLSEKKVIELKPEYSMLAKIFKPLFKTK